MRLKAVKTSAVDADADLTHMLTQDCPTSKSAQIQQRRWNASNQTGSVRSRQLGQFGVGANRVSTDWHEYRRITRFVDLRLVREPFLEMDSQAVFLICRVHVVSTALFASAFWKVDALSRGV